MKLNGMVSVYHESGDPPIQTNTDWDAVAALTDEQVHAAALADPDAQPIPLGTDEDLAKLGLHRVVNVKKLRERLGFTQEAFAATYRIPIGTLRDWEQRRKFPYSFTPHRRTSGSRPPRHGHLPGIARARAGHGQAAAPRSPATASGLRAITVR